MTLLAAHSAGNRRIGIAMMCGVALCYSILDVAAKYLVASLPVIQVVWLRFFVHAVLGLAALGPVYGSKLYRTQNVRLQLLRGVMLSMMTGLNIWALVYLQLDIIGAIQFSVPILVAVFSALWLGERLDGPRWMAILAGFCGVLLIVRPGSSAFHPAIFLSIGNATLYAWFNILTRRLVASDLPATTQWLSAAVPSVLLAPFALTLWRMPEGAWTWAAVVSMGLFGAIGHLLAAQAHRYASAAVLSPYMYQQIVYWGLFGWLVFGHVPDIVVLTGAAVIIGSGLFLLYREMRA